MELGGGPGRAAQRCDAERPLGRHTSWREGAVLSAYPPWGVPYYDERYNGLQNPIPIIEAPIP